MIDQNNILSKKDELRIEGERINLVPFSEKHLNDPSYLNWLRDKEVMKFINRPEYLEKEISFEEVKDYVDKVRKSKRDIFFAIETKEGDFIGTFKIGAINWHLKIADLGIAIGDRSYCGKGLAHEAYKLAVDYCFNVLGFRKLVGGCTEPNLGMIKIFEKTGFEREGFRKEHDFIEGKYVGHLIFGLLKKEFN